MTDFLKNSVSKFSTITKSIKCPICGSDCYVVNNYMVQEFDTNQINYCESDEHHIFESPSRGVGLYHVDKFGEVIKKYE